MWMNFIYVIGAGQMSINTGSYEIFENRCILANITRTYSQILLNSFFEKKSMFCIARCNQDNSCNVVQFNWTSALTQPNAINCYLYSIVGLGAVELQKYLEYYAGQNIYLQNGKLYATTAMPITTVHISASTPSPSPTAAPPLIQIG